MHAVSFALKRAHLRAVAYGLEVVERVRGMTPARFDLLYLLRRRVVADADVVVRDPLAPARSQSELCKDLGLHRSTVARMLKRLNELGWIKKTRSRTDRRTFDVALTRVGLRKIVRAMRRVFRMRVLRCSYENIFCRAQPKMHVVDAMKSTLCVLRKISYAFGDRSRVWYHYGGKVAPPDLPWDLLQAREVHRNLLRAGVKAWPPPPPCRRSRRRGGAGDAAGASSVPTDGAIDDVLADPEIAAFLDRDDGWG
jgi:DNA-binding MarR family transcriptional regulator